MMKKLLTASLLLGSLFTAPASFAWGNMDRLDSMNTMNNNMSQPIVRVKRAYPGMFRGWTDNWGFTNQWGWSTAQQNSMMNSNVCIARCMSNMSMNGAD